MLLFSRTINTLTTSPILTFFWPPFSKQFRLLFPPDFVSPPPPPQVGGRLMKGWSQRNMGETYHGVSQPSHREASYEKFRTAAAVATRELPSVITPPEVQADAPAKSFCWSLFLSFFSHSSVPCIITILSIFNPLPLAWSLLSKFPSSEPFLLTLLYLTTSFPFPSSLLSFMFCFFFLCQAERDLTLINKFHLPRWSRNKVQMQKLIFSPVFFFFCLFNASREKKGIGKACRVINMSDDVVSVIREPVSWCC